MKRLALGAAVALLGMTSHALGIDNAPPVRVTPVAAAMATASGQPIVLPRDNVQVVVSSYDIGPGAALPEHKHPFARYAYVLAGTLEVTNTETGQSRVYKAGDFIIEAIDQWHKGANLGDGPVKLLVIDQVSGDANNVVLRK
jgi:quercetin dioxygenase-like cupin family protein